MTTTSEALSNECIERFAKDFREYLKDREIFQPNGTLLTYQGQECGCCVGAHLAGFFHTNEWYGHTFPHDNEEKEMVGTIEEVAPKIPVLLDDLIEEGVDASYYDFNVMRSFIEDHWDDFGLVLHYQDGIDAFLKFFGIVEYYQDDLNAEAYRFEEILRGLVGTAPWDTIGWETDDPAGALAAALKEFAATRQQTTTQEAT